VVTNSTRWPIIDAVTADFVYARFDDGLERFPHGQSDAQLERHAARIRAWRDGGCDVFFYFDAPKSDPPRPLSTRPPYDAVALQRLVGGDPPSPGATLQEPLW